MISEYLGKNILFDLDKISFEILLFYSGIKFHHPSIDAKNDIFQHTGFFN